MKKICAALIALSFLLAVNAQRPDPVTNTYTTAERDAIGCGVTSPLRLIWNSDTQRLEHCDGAAWQPYEVASLPTVTHANDTIAPELSKINVYPIGSLLATITANLPAVVDGQTVGVCILSAAAVCEPTHYSGSGGQWVLADSGNLNNNLGFDFHDAALTGSQGLTFDAGNSEVTPVNTEKIVTSEGARLAVAAFTASAQKTSYTATLSGTDTLSFIIPKTDLITTPITLQIIENGATNSYAIDLLLDGTTQANIADATEITYISHSVVDYDDFWSVEFVGFNGGVFDIRNWGNDIGDPGDFIAYNYLWLEESLSSPAEDSRTLILDTNSTILGNNLNNKTLNFLAPHTRTSILNEFERIEIQVSNVKQSGSNAGNTYPIHSFPAENLIGDPLRDTILRFNDAVHALRITEANLLESGIRITAASNDGTWAVKMWGVKLPKTLVVPTDNLPTTFVNLGNWQNVNLNNVTTNGMLVGLGTGSAGTGAPNGAFTGSMKVTVIGDWIQQDFLTANAAGTDLLERFSRQSFDGGTTWTAWFGQ